MTTELSLLFTLESEGSPLTKAKAQLAQAQSDVEQAESNERKYDVPVPARLYRALDHYAALVAELERDALAQRRTV